MNVDENSNQQMGEIVLNNSNFQGTLSFANGNAISFTYSGTIINFTRKDILN